MRNGLMYCLMVWLLGLAPQASSQLWLRNATQSLAPITEGQDLRFTFAIRNIGVVPMAVLLDESSCGSLAVQVQPAVIPPGFFGTITCTLQTRGRLGTLERCITVRNALGYAPILLTMRGQVMAASKPAVVYRDTVGQLAWASTREAVGTVLAGQARQWTFRVKNIGQKALRLWPSDSTQPFVALPTDSLLQAGQASEVVVALRPHRVWAAPLSNLREESFVRAVQLITDDRAQPAQTLTLSGIMQWPPLERSANMPQLVLDQADQDLGAQRSGPTLTVTYLLRNNGQSPLEIKKVYPTCGCITIKLDRWLLAPGQQARLVAKFDTKGRTGKQHRTITVLTNDPIEPTSTLHIRCVLAP